MKMKDVLKNSIGFILIVLLPICNSLFAQVTMQSGGAINAAGNQVVDGLVVYGSEGLAKTLKYADIKGSPFLDDQFHNALIYNQQGALIGKVKARLNLYSQELHFINKKGIELAADNNEMNRVVFLDDFDENKTVAVYRNDFGMINGFFGKKVFAKLLSDENGAMKLLKTKVLKIGTYDSAAGTRKGYTFRPEEDYHYYLSGRFEHSRRLSKEKLLSFSKFENELNDYAKKENLDFRKEQDVIKLVDYYNAVLSARTQDKN